MALVTADWNPLGDVFYRKKELYSMGWSEHVDLSKFDVAAAPYGGPIALIPNETKQTAKGAAYKPIIYIFSSAGRELAAIRWNSGTVIHLGWSCSEDLLCVQDDGSVLVYDIHGSFKRTFTMGQEAKEVKVIDCKVFSSYNGTGIAIITGTFRIFLINNVDDPRIRRLAEVPGLDKPPSTWAIINQGRQSQALVASNAELYLVDHGGQYQEQHPPFNSEGRVNEFLDMAISFNQKYLALFTDTGLLWIGSADLQKVYCEFDTKCNTKPQQLVWCGTGAIIAYWENILLMVGPQKDWVKYSYDTPIYMVPELDMVRIVGNYTHEFIQRVPGVVEDIFKIGSMVPGAMLFEAFKEFQKGSQRADEYIRMIKDKLAVAVEQCIEAASQEFESATQKQLLRAAGFGKCFLTDMQPNSFVDMCQMLRVLNAVRDYTIGIPLSYNQLQHLSLTILIDRLVLRQQYGLAIRICQYLKISDADGASKILAHWACRKVQQTNVDDEQIACAIAQKLGDTPGVSYSEIANKAIECGRTELAIRLLDFEPKAAEQVPLLMKIKKEHLALTKAIESGDTDLVYTVILHLKANMPLGEFFMAIRPLPVAHGLFLQYCREQNPKMLQDLYYQEDNFFEEANCRVIASYENESLEERLSTLSAAQDSYNKGRCDWAAKQAEEQIRLLRFQHRLEEQLNRPYLDLSLHQTMHKLIMENQHKHVEQLRKDFKVPDRRYWWLKVKALAEAGDWSELDRFSKSKKSPIGYEPFVEVCIENGNRYEAQKYLPRVLPENKVRCYMKAGQLEQAAEIAFQMKREDELNLILTRCTGMHSALADKIHSMKTQLHAKS